MTDWGVGRYVDTVQAAAQAADPSRRCLVSRSVTQGRNVRAGDKCGQVKAGFQDLDVK